MQIGKAFSYTFEDPKWFSKLLIGALISIVPVVNFAWGGYTCEIIRRVSRQDPEPLAGWDEFGEKFVQGLVLVIAGFIYSLPIIILSLLMIPLFAGAAATEGDIQSVLATAGTGVGILLGCLITLYALLLSVFMPAVQVNYARKTTFGSCFEIGAIIRLATSNLGNYLLAWLAYLVFALLVGLIGGGIASLFAIIPCIGWILSIVITALLTPFIGVVYAHLFGQVGAVA
jgi:Protein of unknown function (DUF4013)